MMPVKTIIHRRLTPVLGGGCLLLGTLWIFLLRGFGASPSWLPPGRLPYRMIDMPGVAAQPPISLDEFASVWQRPLFAPARRPAPPSVVANEPAQLLDGVILTGTVLTGPLRIALLHDTANGKEVRVHLREIYRGWMLSELEARRALFRRDALVTALVLPT